MKSKTVSIWVLAAVLVLGIFLAFRDPAQAASKTGVVTAEVLNVRKGAGTNYDRLTSDGKVVQLENKTKVTILSESDGWYYVSFKYGNDTLKGYVSATYIAVDQEASATPTPSPASSSAAQVTYRTVTTYQAISVPAVMLKKTPVYKTAGSSKLVISKKEVTLAKGAAVTITGEKTMSGKKWFYITFKWNNKSRKGYVRNIKLQMTLKTKACAQTASNAKVRKKASSGAAYLTVNKTPVKLPKGTSVKIAADKLVSGSKWYQVTFTLDGKSSKGYLHAKYVKLVKKKVVTKEPVSALTGKQFEKMLTDEGFPDSYRQSLRALHSKYPYWQFKTYKTGLKWSTVLAAESKLGVNLISNSKSKAWKSTESGAYNASTGKWKVFDGSTWVAASKAAIAYYMDPRNFLNEKNIFQFELLEYQSEYQTKEGTNTIIKNTPFYNKSFSYKDVETGEKKTMKYVTAFMQAAKKAGVSPYHLASRVKQEVVTSATTTSIAVTGKNSKYPGIYNFYNIGATSGSNPAQNGLKWASQGTTYLRPWTDPYRSIVGGAQYVGTSYINKGQNTGYLQKFNVTSYERYDHQYMTNVEAAYSEALKTRQAYADSMDKTPIVFYIPVYENMPEEKCAPPQ